MTPLLAEWVARSALRSEPGAAEAAAAQLRVIVQPRQGFTVDEALEAVAEFLLCDPTLPQL